MLVGPLIAPLVCAAIISRPASWRWMYWTCLILAAVLLALIVLFVPETMYTPAAEHKERADADQARSSSTPEPQSVMGTPGSLETPDEKTAAMDEEKVVATVAKEKHVKGKLGLVYLPWREPGRFVASALDPLRQAFYLPILLPCVWAAWVFTVSVGMSIITAQIFEKPPFNYSPVIVGVLFIASIIGAIGGKLLGGRAADWTIAALTARSRSGRREPELRLPATIVPMALMLVGAIMYGDGLQKGTSWEEAIIGSAIFVLATSAIQGIVQTYCVECDLERAASTIPLYNLIKCAFGFSAPFFIPDWAFQGLRTSFIIQGVTAAGAGAAIVAGLLLAGRRIRAAQGLPVLD